MADDKHIRMRLLLRTFGSPLVVGPFMMGATAATAAWAMGGRPELSVFALLAGGLASAGMFFTRLLLRGEKLARQLTEEAALQGQRTAEQSLDDLDRHLAESDDDPRPETALRDLRALLKALEEAETTVPLGHQPMVVELRARANQLFEQCVQSLTQSGRLWQTAQRLNTVAARKPLLAQRERIIEEVQATVKQLSEALVGVQSLGSGTGSSRELTRLREELDQSLEVARTVEERVNNLLNDAVGPVLEQPPKLKPTTQD